MIKNLEKVFNSETWNVLYSSHKFTRVWKFNKSDLKTYSFIDREVGITRQLLLPGQLLIPDKKQYWGVIENFYDLTDKDSENITVVMHGIVNRNLLCDNYDDAVCNSFPHLLILKPEIEPSQTKVFAQYIPEAEISEDFLTVLLRIENARWTPSSCKLDFWAIDFGDFTVWDVKPISQNLLKITLDISKITTPCELKMHPYRVCMTSKRLYTTKDTITVGKVVLKKKHNSNLVFPKEEVPYGC